MPPIGREVQPGHRVLTASMLPDVISECPHCGSKDFVIMGVFTRSFEQQFKDSKPVKEAISLGAQAIQDVEGIVCHKCNIHTIVNDDETYEREGLIFDLHTQIATLQGRVTPPPAGKEWKQ